MKDEILAAVLFLVRFIEKSEKFPRDKLDAFKSQLIELLTERFKNHWFPDCPAKGQGYRCIRVNELHPVDVVLQRAATLVGLSYNDLQLPIELTLWVDPNEVCCRFGESEGSYCTLATFSEKENQFLLSSTSSESPTSERSVSPASDISSGSVEMSTNHNNTKTFITATNSNNNSHLMIHHHQHDMKKGTPKKYRNNKNNSNISSSVNVGGGGYNYHHNNKHSSSNYAPNNLVQHQQQQQQHRHAMTSGGNNCNMSQLSSTWRTNYYEILPHFALNNTNGGGGSSYNNNGYNNYNRPTYPRVSQFQNVLTV